MDFTNNQEEGIAIPPLLFSPSDANGCEQPSCPNCEVLKERLKQLSYCLAVAQRLTNLN